MAGSVGPGLTPAEAGLLGEGAKGESPYPRPPDPHPQSLKKLVAQASRLCIKEFGIQAFFAVEKKPAWFLIQNRETREASP